MAARWRKRWLAHPATQAVLARLIALWLRLVHATSRWTVVDAHHLAAVRAEGRPFIAVFWHGRMMMMRFLLPTSEPFSILMSPHRDGRLIARAMAHLGIGTIDGSTSRAGAAGLMGVVRALKAGRAIGITPDGPRGPRFVVKPGVAAAARLAGVPVLPVAFAVERRRLTASWDRLVVAWPFNRGVYVIGAPIAPDAAEDVDQLGQLIEDRLREVTDAADRACSVAPIPPTDAHA